MVTRSVAGCFEVQEVSQEWLRQEVETYTAMAAEQERRGISASAEYGAEYWAVQARYAELQIPQARTAAQIGGLHAKVSKRGKKSR